MQLVLRSPTRLSTARRGACLAVALCAVALTLFSAQRPASAADDGDDHGMFLRLGAHGGGVLSAFTDDFTGSWAAGGTVFVSWRLGRDVALGVRQALHVTKAPYGDMHGEPRFGERGYGDTPLTEALTYVPTTSMVLTRTVADTCWLHLSFGLAFIASEQMGWYSLKPRLPTLALEVDWQLYDGEVGDLVFTLGSELILPGPEFLGPTMSQDETFNAVLWYPYAGIAWRVDEL